MNAEYAGFFDIGMVQRNEFNAIIMHGTMCLIRRAALESVGGWSSDTIVEDTDLGLSHPRARLDSPITPTGATARTAARHLRSL
jgi:cellulose synthase/poly-beta-1,6-N-acetylglucosamine synthase-like glycosyltransferase